MNGVGIVCDGKDMSKNNFYISVIIQYVAGTNDRVIKSIKRNTCIVYFWTSPNIRKDLLLLVHDADLDGFLVLVKTDKNW